MSRSTGRRWRCAVAAGAALAAVLFFSTPVGAFVTPVGAAITVTPSSGLFNGEIVSVHVSGLPPDDVGAIVECNNDPDQPTVSFVGIPVPVSCSDFLAGSFQSGIVTASASGTVDQTFVAQTGVLGPVVGGPDSTGGDANADAANYPCPPTPAQRAAGDACFIGYGDLRSNLLSQDISFGPPITGTPGVVLNGPSSGPVVQVLGLDFTPYSPISIEECNLTPGEPADPTGLRPVVGCTEPQHEYSTQLVPSALDQDVESDFAVVEGNIGGNAVSAPYPCPPTPANLAAGGSCDIYVQDGGGRSAEAPLGMTGAAPSPTVTLSKSSGLYGGEQISVEGTGFALFAIAVAVECNETPGEPTLEVGATAFPVGCSGPFTTGPFGSGIGDVDASGDFQTTLVLSTGVIGPTAVGLGLDSAGIDANADAANYPCPPTPAQQAVGATCDVVVSDLVGESASTPISFAPEKTFHPSVAVSTAGGPADVSRLDAGESVVITAEGFTPDSPVLIDECVAGPGQPVDPTDGLPLDCLPIAEDGSLVTDDTGAITTGAKILGVGGFFDEPGAPPFPSCAPGRSSATEGCSIVVRDAGRVQAEVPIGLVGST